MAIGRIVRSADFERVLRVAPRTRSPHFLLHHLAASPGSARPRLSTGKNVNGHPPVDDQPAPVVGVWLGMVVPKRHARRAVTRTLVKRAARDIAGRHADGLARGLWVLRLREPFDVRRFPSAASLALQAAVADELAQLFGRAVARAA